MDVAVFGLLALGIVTGIVTGMWCTVGNVFEEVFYRDSVAPWFRGLFALDPQPELMATGVPLIFQVHVTAAWFPVRAVAVQPPGARLEHPDRLLPPQLDPVQGTRGSACGAWPGGVRNRSQSDGSTVRPVKNALHFGDEGQRDRLRDLTADHATDPEGSDAAHGEALEFALAGAGADARFGDYATALRWLDVAEQLNLALPSEYAARRDEWERLAKAPNQGM